MVIRKGLGPKDFFTYLTEASPLTFHLTTLNSLETRN